jgi:hypothetical protein
MKKKKTSAMTSVAGLTDLDFSNTEFLIQKLTKI